MQVLVGRVCACVRARAHACVRECACKSVCTCVNVLQEELLAREDEGAGESVCICAGGKCFGEIQASAGNRG